MILRCFINYDPPPETPVRLGNGTRSLAQELADLLAQLSTGWDPREGADPARLEAEERGLRLLKENLTPAQLSDYEQHRYFDVLGGTTGRRYRIRHGVMMNVDQLAANGRRVCRWCFYPRGALVVGDAMLAQKTALELFEPDALAIAHRY
jgi:hypothetical protein